MTGSRRQRDRILGGAAIGMVVLLSVVSHDSMGLMEGLRWLLVGVFLIGIVVAVLWLPWYSPTTPTAVELSVRFEEVRSMSGAQFEVFVADLFRAMGYRAVVLGGAGDQGVDVIVSRREERVAVQCKNYKRRVGNRPVQEVFAGAQLHRCEKAWVVAPAGFTSGAIALARSTGVSLFDADSVRKWIRRVERLEKESAKVPGPEIRGPLPGNAPVDTEITEKEKRAIWHPHPDDPPKV